jgi:hypothetical protein
MSRLTIDDLVASQQATEKRMEEIAMLLCKKDTSTLGKVANASSALLAGVVFFVGCVIAYQGNQVGVCICLAAALARVERLLNR